MSMDLARITKSAGDLGSLPEYIINNFIPGARPLLDRYPRLVRFIGLVVAFWYLGPVYRLQQIWSSFSDLLVSSVTVSSEEDLFTYLVNWMGEKRTLRADQTLNASTNVLVDDRRRRVRRDMDVDEATPKTNRDSKIRYEQSQGTQWLIHRQTIFFVRRSMGDGYTYYGNRNKRIEDLTISCLGRSTQPIKDLMEEVYRQNKDKERTMTVIRRPFSGGYSSRLSWSRLTSKPRRPLDTVILDATEKAKVLNDVDEYMSEQTAAYYGDRGIPYRRGYLFWGPPGTGKTSFCLALAAKFNLDVYVLTLLDHELTDSDLMSLMNQLPTPSLLLLEDVDTAGLSREKLSRDSSAASVMRGTRNRGPARGSYVKQQDDPGHDEDSETMRSTRISLSGLLNAIDGVAAPEGHILIMTTNKAYELDEALVRAGRISVKVPFRHASQQQAKEIFLRMYIDSSRTESENSTHKDLEDYAGQFASQIPDEKFSPADLQDYLLTHKKTPQSAVTGVESWMKSKYAEWEAQAQARTAQKEQRKKAAERKRQQTAGGSEELVTDGHVETRSVEALMEAAEEEVEAEDGGRA